MISELLSIISNLAPVLGHNMGTFTEMAKGIYCVSSGGVTQANISRWTGRRGSYRSLQRLVHREIDWLKLNLLLLQTYWLESGVESTRYILAVDEVVAKKAGKKTYGVSWFYSSIASKVIRAISFHAVSLVDTQKERSFALHQLQNIKGDKAAGAKKKPAAKKKKPAVKPLAVGEDGIKEAADKEVKAGEKNKKKAGGRPKGSKNKQQEPEQTALSVGFKALLVAVCPVLVGLGLRIKYVVADGAYGNKTCLMIATECGLHLLSKLNRNTSLFLPFCGVYSGHGAPQKYGEQLKYDALPEGNLRSTKTGEGIKTQIYQFSKVWTRHMPVVLNVVIIVKTKIGQNTSAHVVLFTTDPELGWEQLIRFYSLRFQIEFNFRDAKQYFGLADLKNTKQQSVRNAVGMAFFMDNLSLILLEKAKIKYQATECSIQDLKAMFRAEFYLESILNTLHLSDKPVLSDPKFEDIFKIGAVNLKKKAA